MSSQFPRNAISCGIVLCFWLTSSAFSAVITNPSFESNGYVDLTIGSATGWTDNLGANDFFGEINNTDYHTDESYGVTFISPTNGSYNLGNNASLSQTVDLTDIGSIIFDAQLSVHVSGDWETFLEAAFYVDSAKKWSSQTIGTYADQSIDLSGLSGLHTIGFRLNAIAAGNGNGRSACWYEFDNVRTVAVPEPSSIAMFMGIAVSFLLGLTRYSCSDPPLSSRVKFGILEG